VAANAHFTSHFFMERLKKFLRPYLSRRAILLTHKLRAMYAAVRYGFPAHGMLILGVTGTKGKTTTCHFLSSILEEAGFTVGMTTTADFKIADRVWLNNNNMSVMSPLKLQKLLREMRDAHCNAVVVEVTSIGLDQFRLWGIPFKHVGLTNITHDHLDYHKTWAHYQAAKLKLFRWKGLKSATVNGNDPAAAEFIAKTVAPRTWSYDLDHQTILSGVTDSIRAEKISTSAAGSSFLLVAEHETVRVQLSLPGRFSIENALCAACMGLSLNLRLSTIAEGLQAVHNVPGRLEKIETKKGFAVMVDYAHTPDSLEKLYSTMRLAVRGRLIAVLGATGDRDRTKRPIMGALAARFCDYVFVTDEEPYTEDPLAIIEEVAKGVPRGRPLFKAASAKVQRSDKPLLKKGNESGEGEWWWKVSDRTEAIRRAIELCKLDDLVLVTGMGSENFKIVGTEKVPWNDRTVIESILTEKNLL
jgi:UDP-N-acetylmuramoyl-L-alanyl-D-glutamate--2,6-diaminopimelate ligase